MTKHIFSIYNKNEHCFARRLFYDINITYKNIGIIDDVTIDLNEGFNVLTGETGAGKTLIIGSLRNYIRRTFFKRNDKKGRKLFFC